MAFVRKLLFVPILLVLCKVLQGAVVEIIETEGSSGNSASVIITDQGDDDEFYFDSEASYHYKSIKFINSELKSIPSNIFSKFPNITSLDISNSGLNSVSSEKFADLAILEDLTLSDNQVFNLKEDVFTHLPNLKTLALANMSLTKLELKLFSKQGELITLDLQRNNLFGIEPEVLKPLKKLQWLNLRYNKILTLKAKLFANNQHLNTIDLAYNSLKSIDRSAFRETTPNLTNLFLQYNNIPIILAPKCHTLLMHNNSLQTLDVLGPIKYISLSSNQFKYMPSIDYNEVITLDISKNRLQYVLSLIFSNGTKLEKLNLSDNRGTKLYYNSFKGLTSLKQLRMSNMDLYPKDVQMENQFEDLKNLEFLDLSGNFFNEVKLNYFKNSPKLERVFVGKWH